MKSITLQRINFRLLNGCLLIGVLFSGCSDEEVPLSESFIKIYDNSNADLSYHPVDVAETINGFITLSATELSRSDFNGVQLLKMDEEGNFVRERELPTYVNPIGKLYLNPSDSITYFFAMDPTSLNAVLIGINPQFQVEVEQEMIGLTYPLASAVTSTGNLLLLGYDHVSLETEISELSLDGTFISGTSYSIGPGDDVREAIINHYLGENDRPLPFFCGEVSTGNYYFNGFFNYSFSLVFTDFSDAPTGVVQGQDANAGVRATMPLNGNNFAIAGFQFSDNYQLSTATLNPSGISSSEALYPGGNMAELKPYTPSQIIPYSGNKEMIIFASETNGRQILLTFYDAGTGEIVGIHRLGYLNPFTFSSMKVASDNSLLVLGTTFVAGRFERIVLSKISANEISSITN
ncbi:MAG: hypothetical protein AB8B73_02025 [Ekhidna sp.]